MSDVNEGVHRLVLEVKRQRDSSGVVLGGGSTYLADLATLVLDSTVVGDLGDADTIVVTLEAAAS